MLILSLSESISLLQYFIKLTTFLQVYSTLNGSVSKQIICCLWPHLIWAGAWARWPSEAPSSLSVLWGPWTCFKAPSCWMHVCSSYTRTLTFFTEWCNKIKPGWGTMCILIVLSSVWARLEFRLIFLEPCWLYRVRKENLTVHNKVSSYKSKCK